MRQLLFVDVLIVLIGLVGADPAPAPQPAAPAIVRVPWSGAPKKIDPSVKLNGSEFELLTIQGAIGPITWDATTPDSFTLPIKIVELKPKDSIIGLRIGATEPDRYDAPDTPSVAVFATNTGRATLAAWGVKDGKPVKLATFQVDANRAPQPPPGPGPGPQPPPGPVTSFHVIFVVESGKTLTPEQNGVVYGRVVEEYLTKNVTGGKAGFKRRDPDTPSETGVMGEIWTAAKTKLKKTDPPCVVVEKNNNVEIIPLAATPEAMIAVFDEYLKGAK